MTKTEATFRFGIWILAIGLGMPLLAFSWCLLYAEFQRQDKKALEEVAN